VSRNVFAIADRVTSIEMISRVTCTFSDTEESPATRSVMLTSLRKADRFGERIFTRHTRRREGGYGTRRGKVELSIYSNTSPASLAHG